MSTSIAQSTAESDTNSRRNLDSVTIDKFLEDQDLLRGGRKIDLRGLGLITPGALVPLAAICDSLAMSGQPLIVVADDDAVRSYLYRSGFVASLARSATLEPAISAARAQRY